MKNTIPLIRETKFRGIYLALNMLLLLAGAGFAQGRESGYFSAGGKRIAITEFNRSIDTMMDALGVPAASLAIIENNRIVFYRNYGYKTGDGKKNGDAKDKVDANTVFEACSLSKSFLVFIASRLADEGKLDLDKPLYLYLDYDALKHDPRYKLITARMILSHSSGIENWKAFNNPDTLEIVSNPGEKFVYSGEGYNYLGKAITAILHKPIEQYYEEMAFRPLKLQRTYSRFEKEGNSPGNYATGHTTFGKEVKKWKSEQTVPSSSINTTANDYARLIVSFFDHHYFSDKRIRELLQPIVRINDDDKNLFYGPGFEIFYSGEDTSIFQGGSNPGFKAQLCYSVTRKSGIVLLTNGDRGKFMSERISKMTVGLDFSTYFNADVFSQYPSYANTLLKIYNKQGADSMFDKLEAIKASEHNDIGVKTLNELGWIFRDEDKSIAKRLVEENTRLYPGSAEAFWVLGKVDMDLEDYGSAYKSLARAKELRFYDQYGIDYDMKRCREKLAIQQDGSHK